MKASDENNSRMMDVYAAPEFMAEQLENENNSSPYPYNYSEDEFWEDDEITMKCVYASPGRFPGYVVKEESQKEKAADVIKQKIRKPEKKGILSKLFGKWKKQ